MNRTHLLATLAGTLALASLAYAQDKTAPATPPRPTASPTTDMPMKMPTGDPAKVGPDIYKPLLENEKVRVFEVTFAPGASIAMHHHPDHVAYALSGGTLRLTGADGKSNDAVIESGTAMFMPTQDHAAVNMSNNEVKLIVLELKPGAKATKAPPGPDLMKVAGKSYKTILDEDRVRVLDVTFDPGETIPMHSHPDHVIYVIRGGQMKITPKGQKAQTVDFTTGAAVYGDAEAHTAENVGKSEVKAVLFELR